MKVIEDVDKRYVKFSMSFKIFQQVKTYLKKNLTIFEKCF